MKTANEYREKQVLSLKDEIAKLDKEIASKKQRSADLDIIESRRKEIFASIAATDQQSFAAKDAHKALCKSHDAEIETKKNELERLNQSVVNVTSWHSHIAAEKSAEMIGCDMVIQARHSTIEGLVKEESALRTSVSRLSTDKVLALKDTAHALDDNRRAVQTLSDTNARIAQADKDEKMGEAARKAIVSALQEWQDRLTIREDDFNVLVERMKPDFVKIFGETKVNAHVFEPSRPK